LRNGNQLGLSVFRDDSLLIVRVRAGTVHIHIMRVNSWIVPAVAAALIALSGCSGGSATKDKGRGAREMASVPLTTELTGRITALQTSEVRPQVAASSAAASSRKARSSGRADALPDRSQPLSGRRRPGAGQSAERPRHGGGGAGQGRPLQAARPDAGGVRSRIIPTPWRRPARPMPSVAQNKAQLDTAQINLRFTRVPAPITGRIGRSLVTEGALVTTRQTDPLAVIQRLDPIFVDIQQSRADMLALRKALAARTASSRQRRGALKLEDGSDYGQTGTVEFSEVMVEPEAPAR
jgi:membrane fusion protein (multidrug efflux system)